MSAAAPKRYATDGLEESTVKLWDALRRDIPYVYVRYGDGALEAIFGIRQGKTCDGEVYGENLGIALFMAWERLTSAKVCFAGDWLSSKFPTPNHQTRYEREFDTLLTSAKMQPLLIHPECLLLNRESEHLFTFYRELQSRKVLYVGPLACRGAADALGAQFVESPMRPDLLSEIPGLVEQCASREWDVLLWGCGMAGSVLAAQLFNRWPDRWYINTGSAFDAIYRPKSRSGQLSEREAREFYKGVLC